MLSYRMLLIKKIRVTKFIKDILTTGISQIAVVIFSVLLLNIMARALNKELDLRKKLVDFRKEQNNNMDIINLIKIEFNRYIEFND